MGKILAVDYGEKRLGIALSDESKSVAFPKGFIPADNFQLLLDLLREEEVEEIVVGYPKALSGNKTEMTKKVEEFVRRLEDAVGLPVWKIDERLSTSEVLQELKDMGQKYEEQKEMIDSFVAKKMLERYLEQIKDHN